MSYSCPRLEISIPYEECKILSHQVKVQVRHLHGACLRDRLFARQEYLVNYSYSVPPPSQSRLPAPRKFLPTDIKLLRTNFPRETQSCLREGNNYWSLRP